MQFELTKSFLDQLEGLLAERNERAIVEMVHDLHPADIAEILDELDTEDATVFYQYLDAEKAALALIELENEVRVRFLEALTSDAIAKDFIDNLNSDDAADVISELPQERKEEVIAKLESEEQASDIVDLLNYDENSAGGLMAKEMIKVDENWSITRCIREMRKQAESIENVYTIYVVDNTNKLKGTLSLKKLLLAPTKSKIEDLYQKEVRSVKASEKSETVAMIMKKYDLVVLPVVDELGRLIGRITIDDVVDVIQEEAEKDYQMASGISEKVESSDRIWVLTRARLPWLVIGLLGGIFGAQVISVYENDIQIYPEMAFFIPLIAAMGGNVGVQSSAIIVQGLANKSLGMDSLMERLLKELLVALANGFICGAIVLAYNFLFSDSYALSITVSTALLTVVIFASFFGTVTPLVLNRYRIDPALATGPFITTVNDVFGLFIYFMIGRLMYALF
jgi:magnesium transporter